MAPPQLQRLRRACLSERANSCDRPAQLRADATEPGLIAARSAAPRPVLLIAGKPELKGNRFLRNVSPTNVELWELPDTGHTQGLARHPAVWEAHVVGFLDRSLKVGQPQGGAQ